MSARASQLRFGVLCVLGYVALSWAVRFDMRLGDQMASLLYPLDTFSMYARLPGRQASHLLIRDAGGAVHRVTDFSSFDCSEPLRGSAARCAHRRGIEYQFEDLTRYIETHAGPGALQAELITRTWELRPGSPPAPVADCVIAHCRVGR